MLCLVTRLLLIGSSTNGLLPVLLTFAPALHRVPRHPRADDIVTSAYDDPTMGNLVFPTLPGSEWDSMGKDPDAAQHMLTR
jgi:hypothetical protein